MVNDLLPAEGGVVIVDGEAVVITVAGLGVAFSIVLVFTVAGGVTSTVLGYSTVAVVVVVVSGTPGVYSKSDNVNDRKTHTLIQCL